MAFVSQPGPAPLRKGIAARYPMRLFALSLLLLAFLTLAVPFSANAVVSAVQGKGAKAQRQEDPTGGKLALPFETQSKIQNPKSGYPLGDQNPDSRGGPDAFGYVFEDDAEPDPPPPRPPSPTYTWQSGVNRVANTAWQVTRTVSTTSPLDDGVITTTLPYSFTFYGTGYTQLRISTNGNVHFGAPNDWYPDQSYACVPVNSDFVPKAMIAPMWYDFVVPEDVAVGGVFTSLIGTAPNRIYLVEWRHVHKYANESTYATFELLLYESGEIRFQYQQLIGQGVNGRDGMIGIQNADGTIGLPYSCYVEAVVAQRAIRYRLAQVAIFSPARAEGRAAPGATVVYTQTLINRTGISNSFTLAPAGNTWTTTVEPAQTGMLADGSSISVSVWVSSPVTATIGSYDVAHINAISALPSTGAYTATAVLTTSVTSHGVDFSPPGQFGGGAYGATVTYSALFTNTSPVTNTFEIAFTGDDWPTEISPTQVSDIPPLGEASLMVTVHVPVTTTLGASDVVTVTAIGEEPAHGQYFGVTVLTTTAGVWNTRSAMPISRSRGAGVLFTPNNRVYALGGATFGGNANIPILEYDPYANSWTPRASLALNVTNVGAAALGDGIYVAGGYNVASGQVERTLQVYYPLQDRSEVIATDPLPVPRMGSGVAAWGGKLYVIGGSDNSLGGTASVFEYDPTRPAGSRWEQQASLHYPRVYLAATALDDRIYAAGGVPGALTDLDVLEVYNPGLDTWTTLRPMSRARGGLTLVGVDSAYQSGCSSYLFAIGGGWQSQTESVERYDPVADIWEPVSGISWGRRSLMSAYSPDTASLLTFGGWSGQYEIITEAAACGAAPEACPVSFSDVRPTEYFAEAVCYLATHEIISGYADGTFRPYNNTTRGQLAKIIVLAEGWEIDTTGGPHFTDVPTDNPFYQFIETAYNRGIISGYADGTFKWGNNVTRAQLAKIVVLAEGWAIDTTGGPHFSDVPESDPFYAVIETAYNHGIISGYADGTYRPGNSATRGQIAKIVYSAITQP